MRQFRTEKTLPNIIFVVPAKAGTQSAVALI